MNRTYDLITLGRSSLDLFGNEVGVPFPEIKSFAAYVGGSPTNIAVGARRRGLKVALITAVGTDPVGDFILHFLNGEGVDTSYTMRKPEARTSAVVLGIEAPDQVQVVFYRDNAADIQISIDDVTRAPLTDTRAFEFAGTNLSRDPLRSATLFAVEQAHTAGVEVFLDIDLRPGQWHDIRAFGIAIRAALPFVNVAIGTEEEVKAAVLTEAEQLTVSRSRMTDADVSGDIDQAIQTLLALGPDAVIVKRGAAGASVFLESGEVIDTPGFAVEVYNIVGAGDAFASGLIYGRLKRWDWYRATRMGNACGAIVVTRHGCANFMASEDEALAFIEEQGGFGYSDQTLKV